MAKFTPGPAVAAVSGSVGGTTFSRNRYGAYMRFRAKPVISTTPEAQEAKGVLTTQTQRWQNLTDPQRLAWKQYAETHLVTNSLGVAVTLTGHQSFVGINARLDKANATLIDIPPAAAAPEGLQTLILSTDIGLGTFDVAFTPTPLGASEQLWVLATIQNSAGKNYIENLLKLILIAPAASASPVDIETELAARFGTIQVGQKVSVKCAVFDNATGLLSNFLRDDSIVVTT